MEVNSFLLLLYVPSKIEKEKERKNEIILSCFTLFFPFEEFEEGGRRKDSGFVFFRNVKGREKETKKFSFLSHFYIRKNRKKLRCNLDKIDGSCYNKIKVQIFFVA